MIRQGRLCGIFLACVQLLTYVITSFHRIVFNSILQRSIYGCMNALQVTYRKGKGKATGIASPTAQFSLGKGYDLSINLNEIIYCIKN